MIYVGMDYHKRYSQVTAMDEKGEVISKRRLANEPEAIKGYFEGLGGPCQVALEAGRSWGLMYDWLEGEVEQVYLAHPLKVRAIAEARIKTDEIDASVLAHLLRSNLLPCAHIPPKEVREKKQVLRQRMFFVGLRTMVKNRIHDLLDRHHIRTDQFSDLFGKGGMGYLREVKLSSESEEKLLKDQVELLEQLNGHVGKTNELIHQMGEAEPRLKWVKSLPGIGEFLGLLILQEIDQIERFPRAEKLAAYAGLVPSTYASGGRVFHGRITKQGNKYLRWALVEAVVPAITSSPSLRRFYDRVKAKAGANSAKVATARKLLHLVWTVLMEKREYQEQRNPESPSLPPSREGSLKG